MSNLQMLSDIFTEIEAKSGKKDKQAIIESHANNEVFKKAVMYAVHPRINFYIAKLPPRVYAPSDLSGFIDGQPHEDHSVLSDFFLVLDILKNRTMTGNEARELVEDLRSQLTDDEDDAFCRILTKKLRIGATESTFNKVWGADFIPQVKYQKGRELNDKNLANIEYPAYEQIKADGTCCVTERIGDEILHQTRNSSLFTDIDSITESCKKIMLGYPEGTQMDGELVWVDNDTDEILPRKQSNGLSTKSIKGTLTSADLALYTPRYIIWDLVLPGKEEVPYSTRLENLRERLKLITDGNVEVIATQTVNNFEEAMDRYRINRSHGEEGSMLKNMHAPYERTRSKNVVKIKAFKEADLRIKEWHYGDPGSKFENTVGRLSLETDDGLVKCKVGSGFTPAERDWMMEQIEQGKLMNTIITVKFNDVVDDKNKPGVYSLYLVSFVEFRSDKNETNTFDELKDIKKA